MNLWFKAVSFIAKLRDRYRDFLHTLAPHPHPHQRSSLPLDQHPYQCGPFVTVGEPALAHHNHPESWCGTSLGFGQMKNAV